MLKLARNYATRPSAEWRPLFYRILENGMRDLQRRRTVRKRFMTWLPGPKEDPDHEAQDPLDSVADNAPAVPDILMQDQAMQKLEASLARAAGAAARGVHAEKFRRVGRRRDGDGDGLLGRQRQDTLLPRSAHAARATGRGLVMSEETWRVSKRRWKSAAGRCFRTASSASTCARARVSHRRAMRRSRPPSARGRAPGSCACRCSPRRRASRPRRCSAFRSGCTRRSPITAHAGRRRQLRGSGYRRLERQLARQRRDAAGRPGFLRLGGQGRGRGTRCVG